MAHLNPLPLLTIIGCGNANRCDDGVGSHVAARLLEAVAARQFQRVQVFDTGIAGMDVMFRARGSDALIIIDASRSGSEAGSLYEVPGAELANVPDPGYTLHAFRWDHALYAGKQIFRDEFPDDMTVYLIEAENLGLGLELTPCVQAAAERVVAKILQRLEVRAGAGA
jgi:hydrogenase maturation protease